MNRFNRLHHSNRFNQSNLFNRSNRFNMSNWFNQLNRFSLPNLINQTNRNRTDEAVQSKLKWVQSFESVYKLNIYSNFSTKNRYTYPIFPCKLPRDASRKSIPKMNNFWCWKLSSNRENFKLTFFPANYNVMNAVKDKWLNKERTWCMRRLQLNFLLWEK